MTDVQRLLHYHECYLRSWRAIHGEPTTEERQLLQTYLEFLMACVQAGNRPHNGEATPEELETIRANVRRLERRQRQQLLQQLNLED